MVRFHLTTLFVIFFNLSFAFSHQALDEINDDYCTIFKINNSSGKSNSGTYCPIVGTVEDQLHFPSPGTKIIDAYVILELSVTKKGNTKNIEVIESYYRFSQFKIDKEGVTKKVIFKVTPVKGLHRSALKSASKFKFRPKTVSGKPIELEKMIIKLDYLP